MSTDLPLREKWTFQAMDPLVLQRLVVIKKPRESGEHVLMKALLWALYLPEYPDLTVEVSIGARYRPDLVALGDTDRDPPRFWAEAGRVSREKLGALLGRYPGTHFALARWAGRVAPFCALVERALEGLPRQAPVDLIVFPDDSYDRFVGQSGRITIEHDALSWHRFGPPPPRPRRSSARADRSPRRSEGQACRLRRPPDRG